MEHNLDHPPQALRPLCSFLYPSSEVLAGDRRLFREYRKKRDRLL